MAGFSINVNLRTRPALYTPVFDRPNLGLKKDRPVNVGVFGAYQVAVDDDVDAYFVVELPDGHCTYAGVSDIKFLDVAPPEEEALQ